MERGIPGILFHEDLDLLTPYMHTANDVVGLSLNSDELFHRNAQASAVTLYTLARPVAPESILLLMVKDPAEPDTGAELIWGGGFPPYDVHRVADEPEQVRDKANVYAREITGLEYLESSATRPLLYYAVEEFF